MKHRRKLVVGLGALASTFGLIATAGTAQASTADYVSAGGGYAGAVEFESYGDIFKVHDYAADGHGVGVWYRVNDGSAKLLVNNNGAHTTKTFNLEIKEGATVRFMACLTEQSRVLECNGSWSNFSGRVATA